MFTVPEMDGKWLFFSVQSLIKGNKAFLESVDGGLSTIGEVEFGKDVGDVGFDGLLAYQELLRDFVVGTATGDTGENFEFARRQFVEWRLLLILYFVQDTSGDYGVQDAFAAGRRLDGSDKLVSAHIFEQVGERTGLDNAKDLVVLEVRGEHDDARGGCDAFDLAYRARSVHSGHKQVEQKY